MRILTFVFAASLFLISVVFYSELPFPLVFLFGNSILIWCLLNCVALAVEAGIERRRESRAWLTSKAASSPPPAPPRLTPLPLRPE